MPQQILNAVYLFCTIIWRDHSCSFKRNEKLLQSFKEFFLLTIRDSVIMIFYIAKKHQIEPVAGRDVVKKKK